MDLATVLGLIFGFGSIFAGYILEEGVMRALFLLPPAVIVFGGTAGTLLVSFPLSEVKKIPTLFKETLTLRRNMEDELIEFFVKLSEVARKEGLLSLEGVIENEANASFDPMIKEGVKMVVDGTDAELVKNMFETEIYIKEQMKKGEASMFEAAGGFSPTLGIIGTVMGLVKVLGNLSDPEELSKSIASAFIATLYGVAFANLVFLPMAAKLKGKAKQEQLEMELIMEGVLSVQAGENPSIIRRKLNTFRVGKKKSEAGPAPVREE